jgi:hypothetical protein
MTKEVDNVPGDNSFKLYGNPDVAVKVEPSAPAIPPHIAGNLLEFLRRVQSTGMEAVAWVEAYQFVQRHVPQQPQTQPGVPFGGLPATTPK